MPWNREPAKIEMLAGGFKPVAWLDDRDGKGFGKVGGVLSLSK